MWNMALSQMAQWIFLTVYLLLSFGQLSLAQPTWEQSDMTVQQGDKVTVTCKVDLADDPFGVVRVIHKLQDVATGVDEVIITENDDLKNAFLATGRFVVDFSRGADGMASLEMTFDGIRGEDSGKLGCLNIANDDQVAYINIAVQVPVQEIYMVKIEDPNEVQASNGVTIHLREGEPLGVGCVVKMDGTLEQPKVELLVDNTDHTNLFTPLETSEKVKSVDGAPDIETALAKYTYVTSKPTHEFNQKNLTCRATAEGFEPVAASAFLDVKYKPVITCAKYENYAKLSEEVVLECTLRSNPGATLSWFYGPEEEGATEVDVSNPDLGMTIQESPYDEDKTKISLTIANTEESHFTKYYIRAENELGTTSTFVVLHKGAEPATPPPKPDPPKNEPVKGNSGCVIEPSIATSIGLLLMCLLSALLHH